MVFQATFFPLKRGYRTKVLTLEVFISQCCPSCDAAITLAKKAVEEVSGVKLIIRQSDQADRERARSVGIVVSPTFVLEDKIFEVGVPKLEHITHKLKKGLLGKEKRRVLQPTKCP